MKVHTPTHTTYYSGGCDIAVYLLVMVPFVEYTVTERGHSTTTDLHTQGCSNSIQYIHRSHFLLIYVYEKESIMSSVLYT